MAQTLRIGTVATKIIRGQQTEVRYHSTPVVTFDDNVIILNTGGWRSQTTKSRMNQAANQFGLGYEVYQRAGRWFVVFKGRTIPYDESRILILTRKALKIGGDYIR